MTLDRARLMEIVEEMKTYFDVEELLDELCQAMSTKELQENLEWIVDMHDLDEDIKFEAEEEEEEEEDEYEEEEDY